MNVSFNKLVRGREKRALFMMLDIGDDVGEKGFISIAAGPSESRWVKMFK